MKYLTIISLILISSLTLAEEGHEGDEHEAGEHEETSANVGLDKGILEKSESEGFKLSEEAVKTMDIKTMDVHSQQVEIPITALVRIKDEMYIFRLRGGWYKRIELKIIQKGTDKLTLNSNHLSNGDKVVTKGLGFLRTSEIYSEEGATHSH